MLLRQHYIDIKASNISSRWTAMDVSLKTRIANGVAPAHKLQKMSVLFGSICPKIYVRIGPGKVRTWCPLCCHFQYLLLARDNVIHFVTCHLYEIVQLLWAPCVQMLIDVVLFRHCRIRNALVLNSNDLQTPHSAPKRWLDITRTGCER